MKINHDVLIKLMALFGYNRTNEGICNGYTWMWIQSQLLAPHESLQFYKRLKIIEEYQNDLTKLKEKIDFIKTLIISNAGHPEIQKQIYSENIDILEILSFCEGIELYHNPELHQAIFTSSDSIPVSAINNKVQQNNLQLISPIAASDALLEQTKNLVNKSPVNALVNDCFILDPCECSAYFTDLQEWFDQNKDQFASQTRIPIKLGTDNHAIACSYNLLLKKWQFMDINDYEAEEYVRDIEDIDDLTINMQLAFSDDDYLLFNIMPIVIDPSRFSDKALTDLKRINQKHQNLSKERSQVFNSRTASLQYLASKNGDLTVISKLVELGADINITKINGSSPLCIACQTKEYKVAQFLVSHGAQINHKKNNGETPLHLAVQNGDFDIVSLLLTNKAEVNQTNNSGETPLLRATADNNLKLVQLLLDFNADPNISSSKGANTLDFAFKHKNIEMIKLLVAKGASVDYDLYNSLTPLIGAINFGDEELVRLILEKGADPDTTDLDGITPLYWACMLGNDKLAYLLLKQSSRSVNKICDTGHTPFLVSCLSEFSRQAYNLFRILIHFGADINARNDEKESCLELAIKSKNPAAIKVLLTYFKEHSLKYEDYLSSEFSSNSEQMHYFESISKTLEFHSIKRSSSFFMEDESNIKADILPFQASLSLQ